MESIRNVPTLGKLAQQLEKVSADLHTCCLSRCSQREGAHIHATSPRLCGVIVPEQCTVPLSEAKAKPDRVIKLVLLIGSDGRIGT